MSLTLESDVYICIGKTFLYIGHVFLLNNQVGLGSIGVVTKGGAVIKLSQLTKV